MKDITNIDWKQPYAKRVCCAEEPGPHAKQKVFFVQNGIEYDGAGVACNKAQVKKYYTDVAAQAQSDADAAAQAAKDAVANADAAIKQAGITKTAARKAAG